jgi:hypothetical protein
MIGRGMSPLQANAEGCVSAPADKVYRYLADMRQHHPRFLPAAFSDFEVETGGIGAGTVIRYQIRIGGRSRSVRAEVGEPEPGRTLTESETGSSAVTTFTVTPAGTSSRVRISSEWAGARGIGGFFERLFAPRVLRRLFGDELRRLDAYARSLSELQ